MSSRSKAVLLATYFLVQVLFVFLGSDAYHLRLDDTFYYFGIARHAAEDGRISFDGIHLTNGFQPLWQFILIAITKIVGSHDRHLMMRVYFIVCALCNTISARLAMDLVEQYLGGRQGRVALFFFLWFPGITVSLLAGMESCVNWPLLLAFFRLLGDENGRIGLDWMPQRRFSALIGVSALMVYARLDNAVILAITVLYLWARERSFKRGLVWGAAVLAFWAPLLYWGHKAFNSPTPVSGTVKLWNTAHFIAEHGRFTYVKTVIEGFVLSLLGLPASALGMGYYELMKPLVLRVGFSLVVGIIGIVGISAPVLLVLALRRAKWPEPTPSILPLLALISGVHLFTLVAMFPDQWMYAGLIWYDLVEYLCLFLFIGWLGGWLLGSLGEAAWHKLTLVTLGVGVLAVLPMMTWRPQVPTEGQIKLQAAEWINQHLPENAIVASDDAGVLGYFARVPVVNLDGLVNNRDYLDHYLRTGHKRQYLIDAGITHLADIDCPKTQKARFRSMLHIPEDGQIVLKLTGNEHDLDFCIVQIQNH